MGPTVIFDTFYGATHQYARELAERTGARLLELDMAGNQAELDRLHAERAPLVVLSPVHGPQIRGAAFVAEHGFSHRPVAVAAVGMTLLEDARKKDQLSGALGDYPAVERFYLPGRMNYSALSAKHRAIMTSLITALKLKPRKSDNEKYMIECFDRDVDHVDLAELEPIAEWIGRNSALG